MRLHKKGKRKLGMFLEVRSEWIYTAFRKPRDIFRNAKKGQRTSVSGAIDKEEAMWAIDRETLGEAKRSGCKWICILMRPQRIIYATSIENFFDPTKYKSHDYGGKGGSDQRLLHFSHFKVVDFSHKI